MLKSSSHREAIAALLRRVDEVRSLSGLPPAVTDGRADEVGLLLALAGELVDELERSHRRLIETNVQLVSLREVAHSIVTSQGGEEATRSVTSYLLKAFDFREVFLLLAEPDAGILEGTWSRSGADGEVRSHGVRLSLIGEPGVVLRALWQNRTSTVRDPRTNPPFAAPDGHPLHELLAELSSYTVIPLQRSRSPLGDEAPDACPAGCPFHPGHTADRVPAPGAHPDREAERDAHRRRCLECNRFPVLGVIGVGRSGRGAGPTPGETTLLESVALSVAPVLENAALYIDLRKGRRYLDHILNSMSAGLVAVGLDRRVLTVNRAAEELTGHQAAYVVGEPLEVVFPAGARRLVETTLGAQREFLRQESEVARADGSAVPVSLTTALLRDERRQVYGAIVTFSDLTHVKRMEEQIRQLDRLAVLGRFTSSVAHEIRNPLAGIAAGVDYLSKGLKAGSPQREHLLFVQAEINRLDRIVGDLFTVTHPKRLFLQAVPLVEIVDRSLQSLQGVLYLKRVRIEKDLPDDLPRAMLDADQMQQVLINLIKNAAEVSPPGGAVRVRAWCAPSAPEPNRPRGGDRSLCLEVADDGPGVPAEHLQHLFEPFFTTKQGGTGLGLYVSHDIVKRHGGELRARSRAEGGAAFLVELPLEAAPHGRGSG